MLDYSIPWFLQDCLPLCKLSYVEDPELDLGLVEVVEVGGRKADVPPEPLVALRPPSDPARELGSGFKADFTWVPI